MVTAGTSSGESQRDRATPLWNICPTTLPVVAGSHRHVHLIDAGIHIQDETVHAPAGLCADKDCETIPLLKWRLDRYVLKTGRVSGVRATVAAVARTTRRFTGARTTCSTARVSAGSQGPAVMEETKENHESSCLPRHERCQRCFSSGCEDREAYRCRRENHDHKHLRL